MKRRTITISNKQDKELHQLAKEEGLPFSEIIRSALDEYLQKQQKLKYIRKAMEEAIFK